MKLEFLPFPLHTHTHTHAPKIEHLFHYILWALNKIVSYNHLANISPSLCLSLPDLKVCTVTYEFYTVQRLLAL